VALDPNNEEAEFSSFSGLASQLATDRTINDVENIQTKLILPDLKCMPHFTSILFFPLFSSENIFEFLVIFANFGPSTELFISYCFYKIFYSLPFLTV